MRSRISAAIAFLLGFAILLIALCHYYLLPAFDALKHATPADKARLRAWSALLLALILFILISGLILTFRIGRFFFPRPTSPRAPTHPPAPSAVAGKPAQPAPPHTSS